MKKTVLLLVLAILFGCTPENLEVIYSPPKKAHDMALPDTNLTTYMVRDILGESTNLISLLCTSPKINMWSRWKPVRLPINGGITGGDLASVDFGLKIIQSTNYTDVVEAAITYQKPFGDSTSPYRIGDFRNYEHESEAIVELPGDIVIFDEQEITISLPFPPYVDGGINLIEFSGLIGESYYGIVFKKGESEYIQTAENNISYGSSSIIIDTSHPIFQLGGEIELSHVLVNQKIDVFSILADLINNPPMFMGLPTAEGTINKTQITVIPKTIESTINKVGVSESILSDVTPFTIENGQRYLTSGSVYIEVEITNNTLQSIILSSDPLNSNLYLSATPTYTGIESSQVVPNMYNFEGTPVTETTIISGSSKTIIVGVDNLLLLNNGVEESAGNSNIFSTIQLFKDQDVIADLQIGFKNSI